MLVLKVLAEKDNTSFQFLIVLFGKRLGTKVKEKGIEHGTIR